MKERTIRHLFYKMISIESIFPQLKNLSDVFYQGIKAICLLTFQRNSQRKSDMSTSYHKLYGSFLKVLQFSVAG